MGSSQSTPQPSPASTNPTASPLALTPKPNPQPQHSQPTQRELDRQQIPLLKQPGPRLILGGLVFSLASTIITRRALARRRLPIPTAPIPTTAMPAQRQAITGMPRVETGRQQAPLAASSGEGGALTGTVSHRVGAAPVTETAPLGPRVTEGSPSPSTIAAASTNTTSSPSAEIHPSDPSPEDQLNSSGPILALEALTLATLHVISFGMLVTGGILYHFDIRSMDDLRRKVRGGLGVDGTGRTEQEVEEELEEWVVDVLTRKREKERVRERVSGRVEGVGDGAGEEVVVRNEVGKVRGLGGTRGWW